MKLRLGVAGSPIAHSLSPILHQAGLRMMGYEGDSETLEVANGKLTTIASLIPARFDALSVTMPLKTEWASQCDELSPAAERSGAINSVFMSNGSLIGLNVDGEGLLWSLKDLADFNSDGAHVKILGSGGSARGIIDALISQGASSIAIHARNEQSVAEISERYKNVFDFALVYRPVDLIINTIPLSGRGHEAAVLQGVNPDTIAVDITYGDTSSQWLQLHKELGCVVFDGKPMLAYQAACQMNSWWNATLDPKELLRENS
jgi:shikimate dehydrogenase